MAPMPADNIAAIANDLVVYVPDENCRNPSKEAMHQQDLGAQAGQDQDLRCEEDLPWGQKKLASISLLHDYRIILRTFIKASVISMSHKFSPNLQ